MITILMEKVNNMQKHKGYKYKQREANSKNQIEMWKIKNIVTKVKNVFIGLIGRLDMAKERISEHEGISINFPNWNAKRKK